MTFRTYFTSAKVRFFPFIFNNVKWARFRIALHARFGNFTKESEDSTMRDLFSLNPRPEAFNASLLMQWKQIHIFTAEKVTNQTCIRYIFTTIQILFVDIVFALIIPKNSAVLCIWFLYSIPVRNGRQTQR